MAMQRVINQVLKKRPQFQSSWKAPSLLPSIELNAEQEIATSAGQNLLKAFAVLGVGVSGVLSFASVAYADGAEHGIACPSYPWPSKGTLGSDPSTGQGQKLFQNNCASCHTSLMSYPAAAYVEEDSVKTLTAEIEVVNMPSDGGKIITSITNEQASKFANEGSYLSDMNLITKIREGIHYNDGAITMPKIPTEGAVEYENGTPATESEMEKDMTPSVAAGSQVDERKLVGFKWIFVMSLALLQAAY